MTEYDRIIQKVKEAVELITVWNDNIDFGYNWIIIFVLWFVSTFIIELIVIVGLNSLYIIKDPAAFNLPILGLNIAGFLTAIVFPVYCVLFTIMSLQEDEWAMQVYSKMKTRIDKESESVDEE